MAAQLFVLGEQEQHDDSLASGALEVAMKSSTVDTFAQGCTVVAIGALFFAIILALSLVWAPELTETMVIRALFSVMIVLFGALFGLYVSTAYTRYLLGSKGRAAEESK